MKTSNWLANEDEAEMRRACEDPQMSELMQSVVKRDMRALWIVEWNLQIINAVNRGIGWYRQQAMAETPREFISAMVRPGADVDQKLTHRMLALIRSGQAQSQLQTGIFRFFKVTSCQVLDKLESVRKLVEIDEARLLFGEFLALLEKYRTGKLPDEVAERLLQEKVLSYTGMLARVAEAFKRYEAELLGCEVISVREEREEVRMDKLEESVRQIARHTKTSPVSFAVRQWVMNQWEYYSHHPEALPMDVARRRVYRKDVWEAVRGEAAKRGIVSLKHFCNVLHAGQTAANRQG